MTDTAFCAMGRALALSLIFGAVAPAALAQGAPSLSRPREAADIFVAATAAGDADRIAAIYAPDAMMLAPGAAPINGRDAIAAVFRRNFAVGKNVIAFSKIRSDVGADRAALYWEWSTTITPAGGSPRKIEGRSLVYFRKLGEAWLISADMMHIEPPR